MLYVLSFMLCWVILFDCEALRGCWTVKSTNTVYLLTYLGPKDIFFIFNKTNKPWLVWWFWRLQINSMNLMCRNWQQRGHTCDSGLLGAASQNSVLQNSEWMFGSVEPISLSFSKQITYFFSFITIYFSLPSSTSLKFWPPTLHSFTVSLVLPINFCFFSFSSCGFLYSTDK